MFRSSKSPCRLINMNRSGNNNNNNKKIMNIAKEFALLCRHWGFTEGFDQESLLHYCQSSAALGVAYRGRNKKWEDKLEGDCNIPGQK